MFPEKIRFWFKNYTLVAFMILVFFGWLILWSVWMLVIFIMQPH